MDDIDLPSKELALCRAASMGHLNDIGYLQCFYDADACFTTKNDFSPVDWAYFNGHMTAVYKLQLNQPSRSKLPSLLNKYKLGPGWPTKNLALYLAAEKGNSQDVYILLNTYQANATLKYKNNQSALEVAIEKII